MGPRFRKPPRKLTGQQKADLVNMRLGGATWQAIGRAFQMQEGDAKSVFLRATQTSATSCQVEPSSIGE